MKSILVLILVCLQSFSVLAIECESTGNGNLAYKDRGNRCEGTKDIKASVPDIELLSATAYREQHLELPEKLNVKFCTKNPKDIYFRAREYVYEKYYFLDKIIPKQHGSCYEFGWPSKDVLSNLDMKMNKLAVLARLGYDSPKIEETVLPVIFYGDNYPTEISNYSFYFKTSGDARIYGYDVFKKNRLIYENIDEFDAYENKQFPLEWNTYKATKGWYRLIFKGYLKSSDKSFIQTVNFYHQKF